MFVTTIGFTIAMLLGHAIFNPTFMVSGTRTVKEARADDEAIDTHNLHERLEWFIANHPKPEISVKLHEQIARGFIVISWTGRGAAQFQLVPTEMIPNWSKPYQGFVPFLFIDPAILSTYPNHFTDAVLYHEYVHIRQWHEKRFPQEAFILRPVKNLASDKQLDICMKKWYAELNAYQEECRWLSEQNWFDVLPICRLVDTPMFDLKLFEVMLVEDETIQWCKDVFGDDLPIRLPR